jgi:saccharopine dehydrogenase-like NADP-dependent oxidoreductase
MRAVVLGVGAVGARAARQLASTDGLTGLVVADIERSRAADVAAALGPPATAATWTPALLDEADVVVLAVPVEAHDHRGAAEAALERGAHVVSTADSVAAVRRLLDLDAEARERALSVVVAAGFAPGLSCVLARHAAAAFTAVEEIHVAKAGAGGPACARQHHRALASRALDWRDGAWAQGRGGSGRELAWFPDPIGGRDCYRGGLPDGLVLVPAFPGVERVTARLAASRRDRVTARLPMLRRPHAEGSLGAVRVEVRGRRGSAQEVRVLGVIDRPAVAAAAVAAVAAMWAAEGQFTRPGAAGLAELVAEPVPFLHELARRGVRAAVFEGVG